MRSRFFLWAGVLLLATTFFSAPASAQAKSTGLTPVRYQGDKGLVGYGVLYLKVAHALGFDKEQGIEFVNVGSGGSGGPANIQILVAGTTDVCFSNTAPVISATKAGLRLKLVASVGSNETFDDHGENQPSGGLVSLKKTGISKPADLVGKRIGINTLGAHAHYALKHWLRNGAIPSKQVDFVVVPSATSVQALIQGELDGYYTASTAKQVFEQVRRAGGDPTILNELGILGPVGIGGLIVTEELTKKDPELVKRIVAAYVKAFDWTNSDVASYRRLGAKILKDEGGDPSVAQDLLGNRREHALQLASDIQTWADELVDDGKIREGQVDLASVWTNEFNPYFKK